MKEKEPCERQKKGMVNNCALCENANKEIYNRCATKGAGGE